MQRRQDNQTLSQIVIPAGRGPFRAFRNANYVRLWASNALMYTSRWMLMILLAWLTLEMTDAPWLVALVGFFSQIPTLVLGLLGGIMADRVNRYRLLVITQAVSVAAGLLMTLMLVSGAVQVWHGYSLAAITGICWALSFPARRAILYDLLGSAELTNAIALDTVGMNVSRMIGPALAGVLIGAIGVSGGFIVMVGTNALGLLLIGLLRVPPQQQEIRQQQSVLRNLMEGFAYIKTDPIIMAVMWITLIINLLLFSYTTMVPILARDVLHVDPALMGALQAGEGLGALAGSMLIASRVTMNYHGRIYVGGSLLSLLGLLIFSMSRWYIVSFPAMLLLGLGTAGFATMQSAIVMLVAKSDMRGRALGVLSLAIGAGPLGMLIVGAVAESVSPVFALRVNALLGIVLLSLITLCMPSIMDRIHPQHTS
ncbi:MAG TPA: MFS transporter [Candidatus Entotheonella sp.]